MRVTWGRFVIDAPEDAPLSWGGQALVEVLAAGFGRAHVSQRFADTAIGRGLRYTGHAESRDGNFHELRLDQRDAGSGLAARVTLRSAGGVAACQATTTLTNEGAEPILLLGVTSLALGLGDTHPIADLDLVSGASEWLGEGRWTRQALRDGLVPDLGLLLHGQSGRGRLARVSTGTWSTGSHLPVGGLIDRRRGDAWIWQVEHNGPWRWETGERLAGAYVALLGPTDIDHQWQQWLAPGESFTTVPVSLAVSSQGLEGAVAEMTAHRRHLIRPHLDRAELPVVFNDYMNTLMGDPTTAKLLPLIDAAAETGAEVFCVDAGWYDNSAAWWDSVGEWQPSQTRFPRGIEEVIARIRGRGMVAGLWLEPEVIGVHSPMRDKLPDEAFLQRGGVRLVEHGRFHLDLRHPAAVGHLDEVVDRLVEQLGVGYLKLDYNIDPGAGTDLEAGSVGAGLLGHNRAHLAWLDALLDRHPGLILENCASGGMRADYALLSRMQLQSTSDQQDWRRYPPIAVAAPLSVLPEQAANWAYPQPEMTDEQIAYTMVTGLAGRLYLSGRLDAMSGGQRRLVGDGVDTYRKIRGEIATAAPAWPLGLPAWDDAWLAVALRAPGVTYLALWRRPGATPSVTLPFSQRVTADALYPRGLPAWTTAWSPGGLTVTATGDEPFSARLFRLLPNELPTEGSL
ncbi:glycoside hydrolase family 36 protein [Actinoplanes sp. NPDC051513]|uniref:glycoside hydrolase family 36 protein n=1 Tax=Actinoplanes sp. NPDC051513 TaxID=3363908 RepID=UPI003788031A